MQVATCRPDGLSRQAATFYGHVLDSMAEAQIPFLIGGAYALQRLTGIVRHTKDLDVFVRPQDAERTLTVLARLGWRTELTFPHWLGKVYHDDDFCDVIFASGNGVCTVDDLWLEHALPAEILGERIAAAFALGRRKEAEALPAGGASSRRRFA